MFKAHDIMTEAVVCTYPDMPIYDAIRLLSRRRLTGLPVVDEDLKLVGLLSEKDILRIMNASDDHSENTVSDYMTEDENNEYLFHIESPLGDAEYDGYCEGCIGFELNGSTDWNDE